MTWENVRDTYKNKWVLIEAIEAHSDSSKRIVDKISVIDSFEGSKDALLMYKELHKKVPQRELYVTHTKKKVLEIIERKWLGIRL